MSLSSFPPTEPWKEFLFFLLQALGVLIQMVFCFAFHPHISSLPKRLRQAGNLLYTTGYIVATVPMIGDDSANAGV